MPESTKRLMKIQTVDKKRKKLVEKRSENESELREREMIRKYPVSEEQQK